MVLSRGVALQELVLSITGSDIITLHVDRHTGVKALPRLQLHLEAVTNMNWTNIKQ